MSPCPRRSGQLDLGFSPPITLDVDGHVDSRGVRYFGRATKQLDGSWHVLADVFGSLCVVEVHITF